MDKRIWKVLSFLFILAFIFGCATGLKELRGKEKLEARDWLHSGDLAYKLGDYDNAQYFYELVIKKYPNTYYGRKARENLSYVEYQKGLGQAVEKGKDFLEPLL